VGCLGIRNLKGKAAQELWENGRTKHLPRAYWARARLLLEIMNSSTALKNLKILGSPPDVRLHKLQGEHSGYWSVTIHKTSGWRIIFKFEKNEFCNVEIVDYHGG
jgi:plasmid maintenance system killer protein